jgi:tetratricopeptide (TPR) repeat protein
MKGLVEEGKLHNREGIWQIDLNVLKGHELPKSIREAVAGRLKRLGRSGRDILAALAVLGGDVGFDLLCGLWGGGPEAMIGSLIGLEKKGIIKKFEGEEGLAFDFCHPELRDRCYAAISRKSRRDLHARAAELLMRVGGQRPPEELARHLLEAGDSEGALRFYLASGWRDLGQSNKEKAAATLERILRACEERLEPQRPADEEERRDFYRGLVKLGTLLSQMGEFAGALERLDAALGEGRSCLGEEDLAEAHRERGRIYLRQGLYPDADREIRQGLTMAVRCGSSLEKARLILLQGNLSLWRGDYARAAELSRQSLQTFRQAGREQEAAPVFKNFFCAEFFQGHRDQARQYLEESLRISQGNRRIISRLLRRLGIDEVEIGDYEQAVEILREQKEGPGPLGDSAGVLVYLSNLGAAYELKGKSGAQMSYYARKLELLRALGGTEGAVYCLSNMGILAKRRGEYEEALLYFDGALELAEQLRSIQARALVLRNKGETFLDLAMVREAREIIGEALRTSERIGCRWLLGYCWLSLGRIDLAEGNFPEAERNFEEARTVFNAIGNRMALVDLFIEMADLACDLERPKVAEGLIEQCLDESGLPYAGERSHMVFLQGRITRIKGGKDLKKALDLFRRALELEAKVGVPELRCRILEELGRVCAALGKPEEAVEYLVEGLEIMRILWKRLPVDLRGGYLGNRRRREMRRRFKRLKSKL